MLTIKLIREGEETKKYMPNDVIQIIIQNDVHVPITIKCEIYDTQDERRFVGVDKGEVITFQTRIKYTSLFGEWKIKIFTLKNELIDIVPFQMVRKITKPVPVQSTPEKEQGISPSLTKQVLIPINEIHGIGPTYEARLHSHDIRFIHELIEHGKEELMNICKARERSVQSWLDQALEILKEEKHPIKLKYTKVSEEQRDKEVTCLKGLGSTYAKRLQEINVFTLNEFIAQDIDTILQVSKAKPKQVISWFVQARELLNLPADPSLQILEKGEKLKKHGVTHERPELQQLAGLGPTYAKRFMEQNIVSLRDLLSLSVQDAMLISKANQKKVKSWMTQAKRVLGMHEESIEEPMNEKKNVMFELTTLRGLGQTYAKRLQENGVHDIKELMTVSNEKIREYSKASLKKITQWKTQARQILEDAGVMIKDESENKSP